MDHIRKRSYVKQYKNIIINIIIEWPMDHHKPQGQYNLSLTAFSKTTLTVITWLRTPIQLNITTNPCSEVVAQICQTEMGVGAQYQGSEDIEGQVIGQQPNSLRLTYP